MKYDFDEIVERRNTNCLKWDVLQPIFGRSDLLPMWVADMDFKSPPEVIQAIKQRAEHGVFGYAIRPESCDEAVVSWLQRRHGWSVETQWLAFTPGVVAGIVAAINAFTQPGDKVVIQSPVYHPFFSIIRNNGRQIVNNQLILMGNRYVMDLDDLAAKVDRRTKMVILCSPHNPGGRVWTRDELSALGELCVRHGLLVVSDEIHCDLVFPGAHHVPFASISDEFANKSITFISPSKTFNLAGLSTSVAIVPNPALLSQFQIALRNSEMHRANIFGLVALEAAYRYGEDWLEELLGYLLGNLNFLADYLAARIPQIRLIRPEGTFLAWLDCRQLGMAKAELRDFFINKAKVALNDGPTFGPGGEGFQRLNFGCPRSMLEEGLRRIEAALTVIRAQH